MVFEADNIDWRANAGQILDRLARALPAHPRLEINVFGSASLQLIIEPTFLSDPTLKTRLANVHLPPEN
jgi:hypothetical protein